MSEIKEGSVDSMPVAKRQLRAEAVERLRGLGEHVMASSIQWALFGPERDNMPPNELRDALIDLLTDDEPKQAAEEALNAANARFEKAKDLVLDMQAYMASRPFTVEEYEAYNELGDRISENMRKLGIGA